MEHKLLAIVEHHSTESIRFVQWPYVLHDVIRLFIIPFLHDFPMVIMDILGLIL
jgi:hypothetical protein